MKLLATTVGAALLVQVATPLQAQAEEPSSPPETFTKVLDCRSVADSVARLACYDAAVGSLAEAQQSKALVVVSREDVREARRGLFGFSLPKLRLFGGGKDEDEEEEAQFQELTSTIASVRQSQRGYVFSLPDGAVWEQTDSIYLGNVREGQTVVIKRAALGSYMARVGTGRAARVKRVK